MKKQKRKVPPDDGTRLIGYARVSTDEQILDLQLDALRKEGVLEDNLYAEHVSGVSARRPMLELALMDARPGDTFIVWKLDRLGRSITDLYKKVEDLEKRGIAFRSLRDYIDTKSAAGKLMFGMLALMAQFERDQTVERTKAGMAAARARGKKPGQPRKMPPKGDKKLEAQLRKMTVEEVANLYKCKPQTVYSRYNAKELEALRRRKK